MADSERYLLAPSNLPLIFPSSSSASIIIDRQAGFRSCDVL